MRRFAPIVIVLLAIALRVFALSTDSFRGLDWSAGQLTDEGFYTHNARNFVLYGHARTDEFNNMLLAPLLHFLQVAVFSRFGVGLVPARSISVVCGLLSLPLFYAACRHAFGARVAAHAMLFLSLDHTYLLFNRMALMDTPATLIAVAAFYAFVRSATLPHEGGGYRWHGKPDSAPEQASRSVSSGSTSPLAAEQVSSTFRRQWGWTWLFLCGLLLGITVTNRSLCAYLVPVPFLALWLSGGKRLDAGLRRHATAIIGGVAVVIVVYLAVWYWPNRAEIGHMSHSYRVQQLQPDSVRHLVMNLQHALFGDQRGTTAYLFRHTPATFCLVLLLLAGLGVQAFRRPGVQERHAVSPSPPLPLSPSTLYLLAWLLLGWAMLAVISYSPSRYYVPTYPALFALAALALDNIGSLWSAFWAAERQARLVRALLIWLLTYHAAEVLVHHGGIVPSLATWLALYAAPTILAAAAARSAVPAEGNRRADPPSPRGGVTDIVGGDGDSALQSRGCPPAHTAARGGCYGEYAVEEEVVDVIPREPPATEESGRARRGPITRLAIVALALWLVVNAAWFAGWLTHLATTQVDASHFLAARLPAGSILIGDPAPGLCTENKFICVPVLPGLANGRGVMQKIAGAPRYITVVADTPLKKRFWNKSYPGLLAPEKRVLTINVVQFPIELYDAGAQPIVAAPIERKKRSSE